MSLNFTYSDADEDSEYVPSEYFEDAELEIEEGYDDESESQSGISASTPTQNDASTHDSGHTTPLEIFLRRAAFSHPGEVADGITQFLTRNGARFFIRRLADDDDDEYWEGGGNSNNQKKWFPEVTEPQAAGQELLRSGEFGRLGPLYKSVSPGAKGRTLGQKLRASKLAPRGAIREDLARGLVPNTCGTIVAKYDSNPYSGQYSADSSFYYTCCQDFRLHVYDTSLPPLMNGNDVEAHSNDHHDTTMKTLKTIEGVPGNWTITDSHLSPDNERMIYSSINTVVHMTRTRDATNEQIPIDLGDRTGPGINRWDTGFTDSFGIYSCRFSADGNEIVAGGSGNIFVYDLTAMRTTNRIVAHDDDVNSCCWADSASGNVLISASDDTFLKVWDRRSFSSHSKPAGVLVGHTEGITYVSPKGDGRYVVSNGKDQTMRLWDLRKMRNHSEWEAMPNRSYGLGTSWDYRNGRYRTPRPQETTGASYLYSGSSDGRIHIYSLDGRIVQVLDRSKALPISYDPSETEPPLEGRSTRRNVRYARAALYGQDRSGVVRDVSWHSHEPVLMSVAWGSRNYDGGSVARHEWKGLGRNGMKLEDVVERDALEATTRPGQKSQILPGAYLSTD